MSLKADGVLEPWKGRGYGRIPENFKDPDGCWTGFAARLRVYIVNTDKIPSPGEKDLAARMAGPDLSRAAIGKPLYGTTLSHYCCLWSELGGDKLKEMHKDMLARKLMVLNGNAAVKNAVAGGACDFGWTDTDDFFDAKDEGRPVAMLPIRLDSGKTICIPNTAMIIKGTKRLDKARELVDYLLSEECEMALAASKSRQIPLGPVDEAKLPEDVRPLRKWAADSIRLSDLSGVYADVVKWLKEIY